MREKDCGRRDSAVSAEAECVGIADGPTPCRLMAEEVLDCLWSGGAVIALVVFVD